MKASVIITEFNPLHRGHEYFIRQVRERSGCDFLIAVMSGDFVQRGEPALFNKYVRTEAALHAGVDLVLELPVRSSLGNAGAFASGGVQIADDLGCIDELWFGSESGEIQEFLSLAALLADESPDFKALVSGELKKGLSYPAARAAAAERLFGCSRSSLLEGPNNVLGLEYCTAALRAKAGFSLHTLKRKGSGYNDVLPGNGFASAAAVRNGYLKGGASAVAGLVPEYVFERLSSEPGGLTADDFSQLLKYRLLQETGESLTGYSEVTPDLARRIKNLENECVLLSSFAMKLKTRNITYTHVCRALFNILLGIKKEAQGTSFVRCLGMKDCGPLIRKVRESGSVRFCTQAAAIPKEEYASDLFASDLYESVKAGKFSASFIQEYSRKFIYL